MPIYKLICNQKEQLSHNGKFYREGEVILERVVVTEQEAKIMNERHTETKLVSIEEPKTKFTRPVHMMNKTELQEVAKGLGFELEDVMSKKEMIDAVEKKKLELENENV